VDIDRGLIIFCCGEHFRLFHRNGGVALDQLGHHAA